MHGDEKYRGVRRLRPFSARCEHQFSTCRQTKFSHTSHTILVFAFRLCTTENYYTMHFKVYFNVEEVNALM